MTGAEVAARPPPWTARAHLYLDTDPVLAAQRRRWLIGRDRVFPREALVAVAVARLRGEG